MRELHHAGVVKLIYIETKNMSADILTKATDDATFQRHRATIMNLSAMAAYA